MKDFNKELERTYQEQNDKFVIQQCNKNSFARSISKTKNKSEVFIIYQQQLKSYEMPYTSTQYLDRLYLNGIIYEEDKNYLPYKILIKIQQSTPLGTIIKLKVIIGAFTLDIKVINIQENSYIASKCHDNSGTFGQIYYVRRQYQTSAIKCIRLKQNEANWGKFWKEAFIKVIKEYCICKIFSALEIGPKITKIYGYDIVCFRDTIQFSTEICSRKYQQLKEKNLIKTQFYQALKVMHFFHLVHRDIKPENMMYSQKYCKLVFIDFGTANYISEDIGQPSATNAVGTIRYMSPAMKNILICHNIIDCKIDLHYNDLFALKLAVYEIQTIKQLKQEQNNSVVPELDDSAFLVYLISLIEKYDSKAIQNYRVRLKKYNTQIQKFFIENLQQKNFRYQLIRQNFFQNYQSPSISCDYNYLPIYQEIECIKTSQIILIQKNRSLELFNLGPISNIKNDLESSKVVIEYLVSQLENHYLFPEEGAQEVLQIILKLIIRVIDPENPLLLALQNYTQKTKKIALYYNKKFEIKAIIKEQQRTEKIKILKCEVLRLIIKWQKQNKFIHAISFKRLQILSLCQDFNQTVTKFVDPFQIIDIYFKKFFWNQADQPIFLDQSFLNKFLSKKKIDIEQYQLFCRILQLEKFVGVYKEIEKTEKLKDTLNSIRFKKLRNKMPFTYLAIVRLLTQFYDSYGQYVLLLQTIKQAIEYLEQLPNGIYNQYAKSAFYKYLLYLYKSKENRTKILEYENELTQIQTNIKNKTIDYLNYILPKSQRKSQSQKTNDTVEKGAKEINQNPDQTQQQEKSQIYEQFYQMPFQFISSDPKEIQKLLEIKNFSDLKCISFQAVKWQVLDARTPKQDVTCRKLYLQVPNFPTKIFLEKCIKQSLNRIQKSRFFNHKYDAINSFLFNFIRLQNSLLQIAIEPMKQFRRICQSREQPAHVWFPCYNYFACLVLRNRKLYENMKYQEKNLFQTIISFNIFEKIGNILFYYFSYSCLEKAEQLLLKCFETFRNGHVGSLSNTLDPNSYLIILINNKRIEDVFLLLKSYIQNFYYCGHMQDLLFIFNINEQLQKNLQDPIMQIQLFKHIKMSGFQHNSSMKTFIILYIRQVLKYFDQFDLKQAINCIEITKGLLESIQKCFSTYVLKFYALLALKIYNVEKKNLKNNTLEAYSSYYPVQQLRSKLKQKFLQRFYCREKHCRRKFPHFYKQYNYCFFKEKENKKKYQPFPNEEQQKDKRDFKINNLFYLKSHYRRKQQKITVHYKKKSKQYVDIAIAKCLQQ